MTSETVKVPPYSLDAEEAVLGSLLIDGESLGKILLSLKSQDFYREKNRWTYEACVTCYERHEVISQITVAAELARQQKLEATGGPAFLSHVIAQTPTSVHVVYYAAIVAQLALYRRMITAANQIAAIAYSTPPDSEEALNKVEEIVKNLRGKKRSRTKGGFSI